VRQLEGEAMAAKKKDSDLYQRKNKLIPKFQELKRITSSAVEKLRHVHGMEGPSVVNNAGVNADAPIAGKTNFFYFLISKSLLFSIEFINRQNVIDELKNQRHFNIDVVDSDDSAAQV
jgi:hypothetical protein